MMLKDIGFMLLGAVLPLLVYILVSWIDYFIYKYKKENND